MPRLIQSGRAAVWLFAGVLAVAGGWLWYRHVNSASSTKALGLHNAAHEPGFRSEAEKAGLDFHMRFLPHEQGANFKVNLYEHGSGVVVGDYDTDGDDDLLLLNQLGFNGLFRNRGDGTFDRDREGERVVGLDDRIKVGGTFSDYDNDGDQDLFITSTRVGNSLFRNDGSRFTDVTREAGVEQVAHSRGTCFFDFDNDGYLDLLVINTAAWTTDERHPAGYFVGPEKLEDLLKSRPENNVLYKNRGDGTFVDVSAGCGLQGPGWCSDAAVFDYDEDGHLDVFIAQLRGQSRLYRNNGNGQFTNVTSETLGRVSFGAMGAKAFDYNNDGHLDLLVTDLSSDMWVGFDEPQLVEARKKYPTTSGRMPELYPDMAAFDRSNAERMGFDPKTVLFGNTFYMNDGRGNFKEVSDAAGVETFWPWGVVTGDFDNDGYEDVFLPSGIGYPYFYWRNHLLMNQKDGTFVERSYNEGIEPPLGGPFLDESIGGRQATRSSRCAACADFDQDGRLDLVVNNFNDRPYYFKNQFPLRHYIAFRLRGTRGNRDAIGAVVRVWMKRQILTRQVHCAGGFLSQSSKMLHFGLGDHPQIDKIEVRWPSGTVQLISDRTIDRMHEIVEP